MSIDVLGRPTMYRPEYCEELIEHMSRGLSFHSFAGKVGVSRETLYNWAERYPEFLYSKKIGEQKSLYFWETTGNDGMREKEHKDDEGKTLYKEKLNSAIWIFNMKNRFKWTDRLETTEGLASKTDEELMQEAKELMSDIESGGV